MWINYINHSHVGMFELGENDACPFIRGESIDFVPGNSDNIDLYSKWINDPKVRKYSRNEIPLTIEEVKKRFFPTEEKEKRWKETITFELWHKKDEKIIGVVGLSHINWYTRWANAFITIGEPEYWDQRIATEATKMLLKYAFDELNLYKIRAGIAIKNEGSWRVAEKAGFTFEGIFKDDFYVDGEYVDEKVFCYLKADWIKTKEKLM